MNLSLDSKKVFAAVFAIVMFCCAQAQAAVPDAAKTSNVTTNGLGVIKGVIRDQLGTAIADATVAIFRVGSTKALKEVKSASDGSFIARVLPGTYTILAVAEGFNPVTLSSVDISRSAELVYGFKLVRAGGGNTLAEKQLDRNSSKWRVRAANSQRTIFQNVEGKSPVDGDSSVDESIEVADNDDAASKRKNQTVVESYFGSTSAGSFTGVNIATLMPMGRNAAVVFAGQVTSLKNGPARFETQVKFRPSSHHQIRTAASIGRLGTIEKSGRESALGQFSAQALDEWTIREGVIVVFGVDYSQFLGAGKDSSVSPRLGLQFDADPKTRIRAAYTAQTEKRSWADAIALEDADVSFQEPVAIDDIVTVNGKAKLNKSSRFEFGVERVLDNSSSVEATAFFDLTLGRGVGLTNIPIDPLGGTGFGDMVANQQGKTQGLRVVYNRRINSTFSAGAGYSAGLGQKISEAGLTDPASFFEARFFQSVFGRLSADFSSGTNVQTIFRLSPQATVFAIDPFQGRLAIYDPSLSVLITQSLPTLGLPIHAQAMVDARNLFGVQTGINTDDGMIRMNAQQRMLRGGILVRF
jgi:hypothetical protein